MDVQQGQPSEYARRLPLPVVAFKGGDADLHKRLEPLFPQYALAAMGLDSPIAKPKNRHRRAEGFLPSELFVRAPFKLPAVVVVLFTADAQLVDKAFIRSLEGVK